MHVLPIDPIWQLDPRHPLPEHERRTSCAIAAVAMVLASTNRPLALDFIRGALLRAGGRDENGHWRHVAQVRLFSASGLLAWRRNWRAPGRDPGWLARHEGYTLEQVAAVRNQTDREPDAPGEVRAWFSVRQVLDAGAPLIASVKPGFGANRQNHQVVVHGYGFNGATESVAITDPLVDPAQCAQPVLITRDRFLSYFNQRAIFVAAPTGRAASIA